MVVGQTAWALHQPQEVAASLWLQNDVLVFRLSSRKHRPKGSRSPEDDAESSRPMR